MFHRKKPTPNELYYRHLIRDAGTITEVGKDVRIYLSNERPLFDWLRSFNVDLSMHYEPSLLRIEKTDLKKIFAAPANSPADFNHVRLKITDASSRIQSTSSFITVSEPLAVIKRNQVTQEKKQEEKKPNPEVLSGMSTTNQIKLLQLTAEKPQFAFSFSELMENAPYKSFKKAFKSHSQRTDRRTAYHDAAQCLSPIAFLKLIHESHTKDPNAFARIMSKQDIDGNTVLHLAAQYQSADAFLELLKIISQHKNYQPWLMTRSHDQWDILLRVARYQTSTVFAALLSHLPKEYIHKRVEEYSIHHAVIAAVAHNHDMLTQLSDAVGESTFLSVLQRATNHNHGSENPLIMSMYSTKSFALVSSRLVTDELVLAFLENSIYREGLLLAFLQSKVLPDSNCLDILMVLLDKYQFKGFTFLKIDADEIFSAALCRHSTQVIALLSTALSPEKIRTIVLSTLQERIMRQVISKQEIIELFLSLDLHIILDPVIYPLIKSEVEPVILGHHIEQTLLKKDKNGNNWFHHAILNETPETLQPAIKVLGEIKQDVGFIDKVLVTVNASGDTLLHAALKNNPGAARHFIQIASRGTIQACQNVGWTERTVSTSGIRECKSSDSNLLMLSLHCGAIDSFPLLLDKLLTSESEELLSQLSSSDITLLLSNITIAALFNIINEKTPPTLYKHFMKEKNRPVTFHRLIDEGDRAEVIRMVRTIAESKEASQLGDILLVKNDDGITLVAKLAALNDSFTSELLSQLAIPENVRKAASEIVARIPLYYESEKSIAESDVAEDKQALLSDLSLRQFIETCSDSRLISFVQHHKETIFLHIGQRNQSYWTLLHTILYSRNSKTVFTILSQFNSFDWISIDAVLVAQDDTGETCLHTACYRDEKVFELFIRRSSRAALNQAAFQVTSGKRPESVLEFALPRQTPQVIAAFLVRVENTVLARLLKGDRHYTIRSRLYFQLACYVIHERGWQTTPILNRLFGHIGRELLTHLRKVSAGKIPPRVIQKALLLLGNSKADLQLKEKWRACLSPQSDLKDHADVPKTSTHYSSFLPCAFHGRKEPGLGGEKKSSPADGQLDQINRLIQTNRIAVKIIHEERSWKDFIFQLANYKHRPNLRKVINKSKPYFKFFHMETDEARKIRLYEYKMKVDYTTTKKQSVSFMPQTLGAPVFGEHHPDRNLVGVLIHFKIEDIKAMFLRDKGTHYRGWVHENREVVEKYQHEISDFNCTDFGTFFMEVVSHPDRVNEMLLKLTRESIVAVVVANDTPEARMIAVQRQMDLKKCVSIDVPIVYYDRLAREMRVLNIEERPLEQKLKI